MRSVSLRTILPVAATMFLCLSTGARVRATTVPNVKGHYFGTCSDNSGGGSVDIDLEEQVARNLVGHVNMVNSREIGFHGKIAPSGTITLKAVNGMVGSFLLTRSQDGNTLSGSYSFHAKKASFVRTGTLSVTR